MANPGKFQIMFLESNIDNRKITFMTESNRVKSRSEVKLLNITTDDKLSFTTHIENSCSTASNYLRALARIHKSISFEQAKYLSKVYIMSTFTYCPLTWMFCSKTANNLINKIYKRSLRVIYEMEDANFEDLLIEDSSWNIHENNIHTFLIEIHKSLNRISLPTMQEFFHLKVIPYSLRNKNLLRLPKTNISRYGKETLCFKESITWNTVPNRYKNLTSLDKFKQQIKMWKQTTCTCKLCKAYSTFILKSTLILYFLLKLVFISYFTVTIC